MAMTDDNKDAEPEQIRLMQRMVDLSVERTELAKERSRLSAGRSRMSEDRTRMSADRSEMSAERTYLNAERTLSVWIRTALAVMVFGIAIDKLGMIVVTHVREGVADQWSSITGSALVAFGTLMALVTGARFLAYVHKYRQHHEVPYRHGPFLAPLFALLASAFGIVLILMMLVFFP